jgi:hypothetical protein
MTLFVMALSFSVRTFRFFSRRRRRIRYQISQKTEKEAILRFLRMPAFGNRSCRQSAFSAGNFPVFFPQNAQNPVAIGSRRSRRKRQFRVPGCGFPPSASLRGYSINISVPVAIWAYALSGFCDRVKMPKNRLVQLGIDIHRTRHTE